METQKNTGPAFATVEEYIASYDGEVRERMEKLRALIRKCSPDIGEKISWGMPTFTLNGNLVHFAAQKKHLGFYPGADVVEAFAAQLAGKYKYSKGAVQFPYSEAMPYDLIEQMVLFGVREAEKSM